MGLAIAKNLLLNDSGSEDAEYDKKLKIVYLSLTKMMLTLIEEVVKEAVLCIPVFNRKHVS